jgi:hypothetical protein
MIIKAIVILKERITESALFEKPKSYPWEKCFFEKTFVVRYNRENRLYYFEYDLLNEKIPDNLKEFVQKVSAETTIPLSNDRKSGKYANVSAQGFVQRINFISGKIRIVVTGPDAEDVASLFSGILAGNVLPIEDWDAEQKKES